MARPPSGNPRKPRRSRSKKDPFRMNFRPEEIYIAENAKEYNDAYPMPREVRNKLRMAFKHFHEKKKLKYIKIAESNYDKMFVDEEKKLFTSFLNRSEIKYLWKSYGLPEPVSDHFFRFLCQETARADSTNIKQTFDEFKKMPDADKAICEREHRTKREKYLIQLKEFRNRLPPQRIDDFESTYGKKELYQLESAQNKINLNQETN